MSFVRFKRRYINSQIRTYTPTYIHTFTNISTSLHNKVCIHITRFECILVNRCVRSVEFYWNNPQYCIVIGGSDAEADASSSSPASFSPLIISLMQKDKQEMNRNSSNNITIGFRLFRVKGLMYPFLTYLPVKSFDSLENNDGFYLMT